MFWVAFGTYEGTLGLNLILWLTGLRAVKLRLTVLVLMRLTVRDVTSSVESTLIKITEVQQRFFAQI